MRWASRSRPSAAICARCWRGWGWPGGASCARAWSMTRCWSIRSKTSMAVQSTIASVPVTAVVPIAGQAAPAALAPLDASAHPALAIVWNQERYDAEIRATRRQMVRGAAELAEGKVRLAMLLLRLRTTQDYKGWG